LETGRNIKQFEMDLFLQESAERFQEYYAEFFLNSLKVNCGK